MKNLNKLQNLCDVVNNRYKSGQNDDDQVKKMFDFEKKINDANVIIGYDDYQAVTIDYLKEQFKQAKEIKQQDGFFIFQFTKVFNGIYSGKYTGRLKINT